MNELEIDCIQRARPGAAHHQITYLGHRGFACRIAVELAIVHIRGDLNAFFTLDPETGQRVYIAVRRESGRCPYLQARLGDAWTDHLLALPECRPSYRVIRDGVGLRPHEAVRFHSPR